MISCQNIHKSYEQLQVLKGVSLTINKGDLVCIVGPSGAGKSTLLHIIGTLDKADSGIVTINNQDISDLKDKELSDFLENVERPAFKQAAYAVRKDESALDIVQDVDDQVGRKIRRQTRGRTADAVPVHPAEHHPRLFSPRKSA